MFYSLLNTVNDKVKWNPTTHDTLLIKDSLDDLELYTALAMEGGGGEGSSMVTFPNEHNGEKERSSPETQSCRRFPFQASWRNITLHVGNTQLAKAIPE